MEFFTDPQNMKIMFLIASSLYTFNFLAKETKKKKKKPAQQPPKQKTEQPAYRSYEETYKDEKQYCENQEQLKRQREEHEQICEQVISQKIRSYLGMKKQFEKSRSDLQKESGWYPGQDGEIMKDITIKDSIVSCQTLKSCNYVPSNVIKKEDEEPSIFREKIRFKANRDRGILFRKKQEEKEEKEEKEARTEKEKKIKKGKRRLKRPKAMNQGLKCSEKAERMLDQCEEGVISSQNQTTENGQILKILQNIPNSGGPVTRIIHKSSQIVYQLK